MGKHHHPGQCELFNVYSKEIIINDYTSKIVFILALSPGMVDTKAMKPRQYHFNLVPRAFLL